MEQYLMEGSFHKVFLSKGNVPSERYNYFIDILLDATRYVRILHALWNRRDEVASCIEAAYEELSVSEATKTLFFSKAEQMKAYAKQVSRYIIIFTHLIQRNWSQVGNKYVFAKPDKHTESALPATDLARILLDYTRELDQII